MSYRIQYDAATDKYEISSRKYTGFPTFFIVLGIAFLTVMTLWSDGENALRSILIPGEDAVTVQAFHTMYADLRSGCGFYDALRDFCTVVIHGA